MKRVIIVGGGVAGLSAGIYALQSGFDVSILRCIQFPGEIAPAGDVTDISLKGVCTG